MLIRLYSKSQVTRTFVSFFWANSCGDGEKGALENVDLAKIMYASPVKNFPQASLGIATTCIKVNDQQN